MRFLHKFPPLRAQRTFREEAEGMWGRQKVWKTPRGQGPLKELSKAHMKNVLCEENEAAVIEPSWGTSDYII